MARTDPQVNFRIPADLNDRIKAAAEKNSRTITAELVSRLEASFQPLAVARPEETHALIEQAVDKAAETMMRVMEKRGWTPPLPPTKGKSKGGT